MEYAFKLLVALYQWKRVRSLISDGKNEIEPFQKCITLLAYLLRIECRNQGDKADMAKSVNLDTKLRVRVKTGTGL